MPRNKYIDERLDDQAQWYDAKATINKRWWYGLRILSFISAACLIRSGFFTALDKNIIGLIGVFLVGIEGAQGLFRFHENWLRYRGTSEALKHEKYSFLHSAGEYGGMKKKEAASRLASRCEALISVENSEWISAPKK